MGLTPRARATRVAGKPWPLAATADRGPRGRHGPAPTATGELERGHAKKGGEVGHEVWNTPPGPGRLSRPGRRHLGQGALHKRPTPQDPFVERPALPATPERRDPFPPPHAPAEAPALELGAAAVGNAGRHERPAAPVGLPDGPAKVAQHGRDLLSERGGRAGDGAG